MKLKNQNVKVDYYAKEVSPLENKAGVGNNRLVLLKIRRQFLITALF